MFIVDAVRIHSRFRQLVLGALFVGLPPTLPAAQAQSLHLVPVDTEIVDGDVNTVALADGVIYVGGEFEMVGPAVGSAARIDLVSGDALDFPFVGGSEAPYVSVAISDGGGGWYVGGDFSEVGGFERIGLARISSDGTLDPLFAANTDGEIEAMALHEGVLYVGGRFGTIDGQARSRIAALDAATGVPTAWDPGADDGVSALAIGPNGLLVGGAFDSIGGAARARFAEIDLATGAATPLSFPVTGSGFRAVRAIAVDGQIAYLGGQFSSVGGTSRSHLAAVDLDAGTVTAWDPSPDQSIFALEVADGALWVGGRFTTIAGSARGCGAAFDLGTGALEAWDPEVEGFGVQAIAHAGSTVIVGGDFQTVAGQRRHHLVQVEAGTGAMTGFAQSAGDVVYALVVSGSGLLVGGDFQTLGGALRSNLAAFDLAIGELTEWAPDVEPSFADIRAMQVESGVVYLGGDFTSIEGQPRNRLAAIDAATGALLPWDPDASDDVFDLVVDDGSVFLAGLFDQVGGQPRVALAEVDAASGAVTPWAPVVSTDEALGLAVSSDTVYVGLYEGNSAEAFDRSSGVATAWAPVAPEDEVCDMVLDGGDVLLGGLFAELDGQPRPYVGAVDPITGAATSWQPAVDEPVQALAVSGDVVFLAGDFTTLGGSRGTTDSVGVGAVDRVTGAAIWTPATTGFGRAVATDGAHVAVGGDFAAMGRGGFLLYRFELPLFTDGFEDGTVDAWSAAAP